MMDEASTSCSPHSSSHSAGDSYWTTPELIHRYQTGTPVNQHSFKYAEETKLGHNPRKEEDRMADFFRGKDSW